MGRDRGDSKAILQLNFSALGETEHDHHCPAKFPSLMVGLMTFRSKCDGWAGSRVLAVSDSKIVILSVSKRLTSVFAFQQFGVLPL